MTISKIKVEYEKKPGRLFAGLSLFVLTVKLIYSGPNLLVEIFTSLFAVL